MAIDLHGFVTPEQDFQGLDKLNYNLQRKNAMAAQAAKDASAKKTASTKFFSNYLDDKQKFTGTKYDPYNHELYSEAIGQAMDLVKQGVNDTDILAAINPLVNKIGQYTQNAQQYALTKKQAMDTVGKIRGVDAQRFSDAYDKLAWEGKDPTQVDPNGNYADQILRTGDIYNDEGFREHFEKSKRNSITENIQRTNSKGGTTRSMEKISAESYLVPDYDQKGDFVGMVPKYQTIQDGGKDLIGKFHTDKGMVDAPIRALDDGEFDILPPSSQAYALQEARKFATEKGIPVGDKRVELLAKSIAYDKMKPFQSVTHETIDNKKDAPAPRYTFNMGGGKETQGDKKIRVMTEDTKTSLDKEPLTEDGKIAVDEYMGGVKYLIGGKGTQEYQEGLLYDPKDHTFTFPNPETGQPKTVSFEKFKSMATSANPNTDMNFIEAFRNYKRNSGEQNVSAETSKPEPTGFLKTTKSFFDRIVNGKPPEKATQPKQKASAPKSLAERMKEAQQKK